MQALKALVIIMGVLIVIGTAVVVVTIYNRVSRMGGQQSAADVPAATGAAPPVADAAPASFGEARLPVPDGCRVVEMVPAGDRLLLRLGSIQRCNRILVIDLDTGSQLGSIDLSPPE
jgi:hypothetical protein